ncbi:hypothetical protein E2320_007019, partial [Naja naja]
MPPITFQDLPLNIYMVIFGTGVFIFVLSLIFCCYFIRNMAAMPDQPGEPDKLLAMLDRPGREASRSKVAMLDGLGSQP